MKKQTKKYAVIGAIAVIVVLAVTMSFSDVLEGLFGGGADFISAKFFDQNGKPIQQSFIPFTLVKSTTGEVLAEGAASMQFTIKAKNTGELPLTMAINQLTPTQLDAAFTKTTKTINPGEEATWVSSQIQTAQFESTMPTFYAKVKGSYTYAGQTSDIFKEGSISYQFIKDPVAGMDMTFGSSLGTSGGGVVPNGTTTLKTSGTSCTANSECQSSICETKAILYNNQIGTPYCHWENAIAADVTSATCPSSCYSCSAISYSRCGNPPAYLGKVLNSGESKVSMACGDCASYINLYCDSSLKACT